MIWILTALLFASNSNLAKASQSFDPDRMATALGASIGAYSQCGSVWTLTDVEKFNFQVDNKFVSAVLQTHPDPSVNAAVLSVRGTDGNDQLLSEINSYLLKPPKPFALAGINASVDVLEYFADAADGLWTQIRPRISARAKPQILVTGHSLGGAVGALLALRVATEFKNLKLDFYSFGEPRVGDYKFSSLFDHWVPSSWRVVHYNDIVPHIPPCSKSLLNPLICSNVGTGKYHHGTEVWFQNNDGAYNLKENKFDSLQSYKVCTGTPVDEDRTCSNSLLATAVSITSHLTYFGTTLNRVGSSFC
jgi:hypothetical protein